MSTARPGGTTGGDEPDPGWSDAYERKVRAAVFAHARPAHHPVGVVVGGQPGAGKTRAVEIAAAEHDAVVIVRDDLRPFHPDYDRLMDTDPVRMPDVTAPATDVWGALALDEAVRRRCSVVFETTLKRTDMAAATARTMREGGMAVEVRVLGVPPVVSMLGVLQRYVDQVATHGAGRWAAQSYHDDTVTGLPATLEHLVDHRLVDRLMVVDRDGTVLHDQHAPTSALEAVAALTAAQDPATITAEQASWWAGEYQRCAQHVAAHETDRDVLEATVRLGQSGLGSIGWPDDASASQVRDAVDAVSGREQPSPVRERLAALRAQPVEPDAGDVRARLRDLVPQPAQDEPPVVGGPSGLQMWAFQKRRSS